MKKDRVLIIALVFSAAWHIFWLSAFSVVVVPKAAKQVKFSGVSFLGPILDTGVFKINVESRERTALEKRYLADVAGESEHLLDNTSKNNYPEVELDEGVLSANGEGLTGLTIAAIDTGKIEPGRDME